MSTSWKNRGSYGLIMHRQIKRFEKVCNEIWNKALREDGSPDLDKLDLNNLIQALRTLFYATQIQLTNVRAAEEFQTLEKLEIWKKELLSKLRSKGVQEEIPTPWQY